MRTLAIGDIHGCHKALMTLLGEVRPEPDDQLVFLGDYTGPAGGGWLTCLDTGSGHYWQANQQGATRAGALKG